MGYQTKELGYTESGYEKNIIVNNSLDDNLIQKNNMFNKLKYMLSLHNDYVDITNNSSIKILATVLNRDGSKKIPYIFKIKNAYGLQFHPEITVRILKIFCNKFTFDKVIIDYAKKNIVYIQDASITLIKNWINIITKKHNNKTIRE